MTNHDPTTGEILDRAADGGGLVPAANSLADFIRMSGPQFDADVYAELREVAADMQNRIQAGAGKVKAKLTITVEIDLEQTGNGTLFYLRPSHKIARPADKQPRAVAWTTDDNRFTPNMPRQGQLFGRVRDVTPGAAVRDA
ncbi:hypothetical protein [Sphingomonas sp.]|uniref:hypothetical protein n=1 Tax=Sphingomonas sp. TaxID=28214 RepID=UPI00307CC964